MDSRTDDDLVRGYLEGSSSDFEALYRRYSSRFFGFVKSLGFTGAEAEDLYQETWLKVIRGLRGYRPKGRFRVWLFQVARNVAIDRVRKRRIEQIPLEEETTVSGAAGRNRGLLHPDEMAGLGEEEAALRQAIENLPSDERQVVLLRVREDMTFRDVSEVLGIPLGTALWRMREAVKRLSGAIHRQNENDREKKR